MTSPHPQPPTFVPPIISKLRLIVSPIITPYFGLKRNQALNLFAALTGLRPGSKKLNTVYIDDYV